jgi:hypothetical protein
VSKCVPAIFVFGLLSSIVGCAPWQVGAEKDVVKNGIRFESFRELGDGSKLGVLVEDTVIDGWPCKKDFIVFYPDWRLDELQLSRDYERNGVFMPEGTWVFPDARGNPGTCMFPRDMEIQGYLCRGGGMGKNGFMTQFYSTGRLRLFWSREPVEVDGFTCKDSLFTGISLHNNGRLRECILDKPVTLSAVTYRKGTRLRLDAEGKVVDHDP